MPRAGIALKLALVMAVFAAVLVGAVGLLAHHRGSRALEILVASELHGAAIGKEGALAGRMDEGLAMLRALAAERDLVERVADASTAEPGPAGEEGAIDTLLRGRSPGAGPFARLFVLGPDGGLLGSSSAIGAVGRLAEQPFFMQGLRGTGLLLVDGPVFGRAPAGEIGGLVAYAPIRQGDAVLGVLAGEIPLATLDRWIAGRSGFRRTDAAYLVTDDGRFATRPGFQRDMAAPPARLTGPIAAGCAAHGNGLVEGLDGRGVAVRAVHRWVPNRNLCLVVQMDRAEALGPVADFARDVTVGAAVALALAGVVGAGVAQMITRPVRRVQDAVTRVAGGARDLTLAETASDELGLLAAGFNRMVAALGEKESQIRRHTAELEQRVAEKTRALGERAAELARSNAELERFAYVASHDLQEPLRMVGSYTQLLAKRYRGRLDADADEFIAFAVDGAARMQTLINDLLAYSRVTTQARAFEPVDMGFMLDRALSNLRAARLESGARIARGDLPTVPADASQVTQLFQNLVGNAIKFRGDQPPEIAIGAEQAGREWIFHVRDNGIGIDRNSVDKLFVLFKRLHSLAEYPGTGIGLAICKKIVERHGGRIWVEPEPGRGSTFRFTIPVALPSRGPADAARDDLAALGRAG